MTNFRFGMCLLLGLLSLSPLAKAGVNPFPGGRFVELPLPLLSYVPSYPGPAAQLGGSATYFVTLQNLSGVRQTGVFMITEGISRLSRSLTTDTRANMTVRLISGANSNQVTVSTPATGNQTVAPFRVDFAVGPNQAVGVQIEIRYDFAPIGTTYQGDLVVNLLSAIAVREGRGAVIASGTYVVGGTDTPGVVSPDNLPSFRHGAPFLFNGGRPF